MLNASPSSNIIVNIVQGCLISRLAATSTHIGYTASLIRVQIEALLSTPVRVVKGDKPTSSWCERI